MLKLLLLATVLVVNPPIIDTALPTVPEWVDCSNTCIVDNGFSKVLIYSQYPVRIWQKSDGSFYDGHDCTTASDGALVCR